MFRYEGCVFQRGIPGSDTPLHGSGGGRFRTRSRFPVNRPGQGASAKERNVSDWAWRVRPMLPFTPASSPTRSIPFGHPRFQPETPDCPRTAALPPRHLRFQPATFASRLTPLLAARRSGHTRPALPPRRTPRRRRAVLRASLRGVRDAEHPDGARCPACPSRASAASHRLALPRTASASRGPAALRGFVPARGSSPSPRA